jgi:GTP-binding protein Era
MSANSSRCGFIAIVGAPNVGKSTLLNRLVGAKVSIVTPKVQTTRARIIAIAGVGEAQLIFVDTPGIFAPRRTLEKAMVKAAWQGAGEADIVLVLLDAALGFDADSKALVTRLPEISGIRALVLNKIDLAAKPKLLALSAESNEAFPFAATFMISAETGDGVEDLKAWLARNVPEGPWLYPADQLADLPERLLAAEITREKLFLQLRQELPYALTVETDRWQERADGSVRIEQTIYVRRQGQKAIVLGEGGRMIKEIGQAARAELEQLFERRVHLFLFVKVRAKWPEEPERYRAMGLEFPG